MNEEMNNQIEKKVTLLSTKNLVTRGIFQIPINSKSCCSCNANCKPIMVSKQSNFNTIIETEI